MNLLNPTTQQLATEPRGCDLARIKQARLQAGQPVFDCGTGDPPLDLWEPIITAMGAGLSRRCQYPSVYGIPELADAQRGYLKRRLGLSLPATELTVLPTRGNKDGIFHLSLSLIGRAGGRRHIMYPDPGYPVYRTSTLLAGGKPYPIRLEAANGYLMEPWRAPAQVIQDCAGIWVNYPHNPTGAVAPSSYWQELLAWCQAHDILVLADDCYLDLYDESSAAPVSPLALKVEQVVAFMSLSKRSGLTGYRLGFMAGDPRILEPHARVRMSMGVTSPMHPQQAAAVAWAEDGHVQSRRQLFDQRRQQLVPFFKEAGLLAHSPTGAFYLWCQVPKPYKDSEHFCEQLAQHGVIFQPGATFGEDHTSYFRVSLNLNAAAWSEARGRITQILNSH